MSDPATPAAPTPPAATPAAPAATPAAPAHAIAWLPADADPELVGHVQNAGWQTPLDAAKSHRDLQKLFGADRHGRTVTIPKDDATPEEWSGYYQKLGRPMTPAEYELPVPEGGDGKFAESVSAKMHELGLSSKQAQALAAWWNEQAGSLDKAAFEAEQANLAAEHAELAKDWGNNQESTMRKELARRAAVHLGLDEGAIDAMEKVAGYSKTMKALAKVGDLMREAQPEGFTELGSFGMTPEGAKAKRSQLLADPVFRKAAMNPAGKEWAEMQRIDSIIAASNPTQ